MMGPMGGITEGQEGEELNEDDDDGHGAQDTYASRAPGMFFSSFGVLFILIDGFCFI